MKRVPTRQGTPKAVPKVARKTGPKPASKAGPKAAPKAARKASPEIAPRIVHGIASKRGRRRPPAPPAEVFARLQREYPDAHCELDHENAYQLLAATILSAQCTDKRVNEVTPTLFARYPTPVALANADPAELQALIKPTGFFRNKTKSLIGMATGIVEAFGRRVPRTLDELITLPGVGRKTANVVLGVAFDTPEGVVVDTHVGRVSRRLGLTKQSDPVKVELDLMREFPREDWTALSHLLIFHGRRVCVARRPRCAACVLNDICPSSEA